MFCFKHEAGSEVRGHIRMPVAIALLLTLAATVPAQAPVGGRSSRL
jgi:hypothetical protein